VRTVFRIVAMLAVIASGSVHAATAASQSTCRQAAADGEAVMSAGQFGSEKTAKVVAGTGAVETAAENSVGDDAQE
jgi:hypothetical protein